MNPLGDMSVPIYRAIARAIRDNAPKAKLATIIVAQYILRLLKQEKTAVDINDLKDLVKREVVSGVERKEAETRQAMAKATNDANAIVSNELILADKEAEIRKKEAEAITSEAEARAKVIEAKTRFIKAMSRLKQQGGEILFDGKELYALVSGPEEESKESKPSEERKKKENKARRRKQEQQQQQQPPPKPPKQGPSTPPTGKLPETPPNQGPPKLPNE